MDAKQMDIFGNETPVEGKKTKKAAPKKEPQKEEPTIIPADATVTYCGRTFDLDREMTLEEIREMMERSGFPELYPENCKMLYSKERNLVTAVPTGGKKGLYTFNAADLKQDAPRTILAARNGIYEIHQNAIGIFSVRKEEVPELDPWREGFVMSLPKIPVSLLYRIIDLFETWAKQELEIMVHIYWDGSGYFLHVPNQEVSSTSIQYLPDRQDINVFAQNILVMEIHSHHKMPAFFSGQDDADEVATRLYGVVGMLQKQTPEMCFRFVCAAKHRSVKIDQVFDLTNENTTNVRCSDNKVVVVG